MIKLLLKQLIRLQTVLFTDHNKIMGSCLESTEQMNKRTFEKAFKVFLQIADKNLKVINRQSVEQYFISYTQSCCDILMRQMDFNRDGIITQNQWMTYWEYIRRAGYDLAKINKELNRIEKGQVTLDFPKAKSFHSHQPRTTLLTSIMNDMKSDPTTFSFLQRIPQKTS